MYIVCTRPKHTPKPKIATPYFKGGCDSSFWWRRRESNLIQEFSTLVQNRNTFRSKPIENNNLLGIVTENEHILTLGTTRFTSKVCTQRAPIWNSNGAYLTTDKYHSIAFKKTLNLHLFTKHNIRCLMQTQTILYLYFHRHLAKKMASRCVPYFQYTSVFVFGVNADGVVHFTSP
jgi:hypothetical protein